MNSMTLDEAIQIVQEHTENDRTRQLYETVQIMNETRKKGEAASEKKKRFYEKKLEDHLTLLRQWGRDVKLVTVDGKQLYTLVPTEEELDMAWRYMRSENAVDVARELKKKEITLRDKISQFADSLEHCREISYHFPVDDIQVEGMTATALEIELLYRECVTERQLLRIVLGLNPESPVKKF